MPKGIPNNGPRKSGCGRKAGEPTTTISFRVPVQYASRLKLAVKNLVNDMKKEEQNEN
jgi:hypothetical protein